MLHRAEWVQAQLSEDKSFDCVTVDAWNRWRKAWGDVPTASKQLYVDQHELGNLMRAAALANTTTTLPIADGAMANGGDVALDGLLVQSDQPNGVIEADEIVVGPTPPTPQPIKQITKVKTMKILSEFVVITLILKDTDFLYCQVLI